MPSSMPAHMCCFPQHVPQTTQIAKPKPEHVRYGNQHHSCHNSITRPRAPVNTSIANTSSTSSAALPQFNHAAPRTREHIHREHEQHVKRRPAVPRQRGAVGEPHVHQDAGHLRARQTHATSDNYYVEISLKQRHVRAYAEICRVTNLGRREKPMAGRLLETVQTYKQYHMGLHACRCGAHPRRYDGDGHAGHPEPQVPRIVLRAPTAHAGGTRVIRGACEDVPGGK